MLNVTITLSDEDQTNNGWTTPTTQSGVTFQLVNWVAYKEIIGEEAPDCWMVIKKGIREGFATKELALNWAEENLK